MTTIPQELFIGLRGSAGDKTASRNAHGQYVYDRVTPTDPNTFKQTFVRNAWRIRSKDWRDTMTPAERAGWILYAAHTPVGYTMKGRRYITGNAHFLRANIIRQRDGLPVKRTPPTVFGLPTFLPIGYKAINGSNQLGITWDNSDDWAQELGSAAFIYATVQHPPSVHAFKPPYLYVGNVPGSATPPVTRTLPYTVQGGRPLFVKVQVQRADVRTSLPRPTRVLAGFF